MTRFLKKLGPFLNVEFDKILAGQILSFLADGAVIFMLIQILGERFTVERMSMAILLFAFFVPQFLLGPCIGILGDRFSRRSALSISLIMKALLVASLSFSLRSEGMGSGVLYLYSFLLGCASAFFTPSRLSATSSLLSSSSMRFANAVSAVASAVFLCMGALLSDPLVARLSLPSALWCVVGTYVLSAVVLSFLRTAESRTGDKPFDLVGDLKFALLYVSDHRKVLSLLFVSIAFAFIAAVFTNMFNLLVNDFYRLELSDFLKIRNVLAAMFIGIVALCVIFSRYLTVSNFCSIGLLIVSLSFMVVSPVAAVNASFWVWLIPVAVLYAMASALIDYVIRQMSPDTVNGKILVLQITMTVFALMSGTLIIANIADGANAVLIFEVLLLMAAALTTAILCYDKPFRIFLVKAFLSWIFSIFYRFRAEGIENLPKRGRCILAGNYSGYLDPFIIQMAAGRHLWFATGADAFGVPLVKSIIGYFNIFQAFNDSPERNRELVARKLKAGGTAVFFAAKDDDGLCRFGDSLYEASSDADCQIVPFVINSSKSMAPGDKAFPAPFSEILIQFGRPVFFSEKKEKDDVLFDLSSRVSFMKNSVERRAVYAKRKSNDKKNYRNFLRLVQERGDILGQRTAFMIKNKKFYDRYSFNELSRLSKNLANYLIEEVRIKRGDRIAILSESRPEVPVSILAVFQTGAAAVPLDAKLTIPEWVSILSDCEPTVILCSNHYTRQVEEIRRQVPSIRHIFIIEKEKPENSPYKTIFEMKCDIMRDLSKPRLLNDLALIVYTSGTTGNPKGVMISFGNIYSQVMDFEKVIDISTKDTLISILPLNHLLELGVGCFGMMFLGAKVCYVSSLNPKEISTTMRDVKATAMIVVPLFLKMLKNSVDKEIRKKPAHVQKVFNFMFRIAPYVPVWVRRRMFKPVLDGFGGKLGLFIVGGAPMEPDVADFFMRIGIRAIQGYGLTETSPVVSVNRLYGKIKSNTVGPPLPSVKVRISDEGEVLVAGGSVMLGYYNKPEMTAEVIDSEGWFHTGDIGAIDKDGHLMITGRIKNMIVLGGGKKVFPEEVEAVLERSALIKEVCVMSMKIKSGNKAGTEQVGAVIVPSDDLLPKTDEEIRKILEKEVKDLSEANLAHYKAPTMIVMRRDEMPKTSTRKVKRKELIKQIEAA